MDRTGRKCHICGRGFTEQEWEDRHEVHEEGCPNSADVHTVNCDCDLPVHAKHCPICQPDKAFFIVKKRAETC